MLNSSVLVLNRSFLPIHVTSVRRAFSLMYCGGAKVVNGDYDVRVRSGDASFAQGPHLVLAKGVPVIDVAATAAGEFADNTARPR